MASKDKNKHIYHKFVHCFWSFFEIWNKFMPVWTTKIAAYWELKSIFDTYNTYFSTVSIIFVYNSMSWIIEIFKFVLLTQQCNIALHRNFPFFRVKNIIFRYRVQIFLNVFFLQIFPYYSNIIQSPM